MMKILIKTRCLILLGFLTLLAGLGAAAHAADQVELQSGSDIKQMPVLKGDMWQKMSTDGKLAFIWGVGHVVTIEKHVEARHPQLKRSDFTAKLSEGLTGIPMEQIVREVDTFYRDHPEALDTPVMRVIWREMVKPKLTLGIADQPITGESESGR